ncbi:MAG: cellulose binding domain-containing protein [Caldilineaceae bacterium]
MLQQPTTGVVLTTHSDEAANHMILLPVDAEGNLPTATPAPTDTPLSPGETPAPTATFTPVPPTSTPTNTFTPVPPTATFTPASPTATPAGTGDCRVKYKDNNDWGSGFVAEVEIRNKTGVTFNGWTITWTFAGNQKITNLWNGFVTQAGANVQVTNAPWNGNVYDNDKVTFGFQATYSGTNAEPTNFVVNGMTCDVIGATELPTFASQPEVVVSAMDRDAATMSSLSIAATTVSLSSLNLPAIQQTSVDAFPLSVSGLTVPSLAVAPISLSLSPVVAAPRLAAPLPQRAALPVLPAAAPAAALNCPNNLILNPSFEAGTANWTGITGTGNHGYVIPDGTKYGYHAGSANSKMYQDVAVIPGNAYSMSFYSASHEPGVQTVAIEYLTAANATVGTPAVHTITIDIDDPSHVFGGPYTLSLGAAPANAAKLRVTVKSNGTDWAKVDAFCLPGVIPTATATPTATSTKTPVPPTATKTPTKTNTPVPPTATWTPTKTNTPVPPTATPTTTSASAPEVEYCTYNLRVKVGETFNIRDYVRYKDSDLQSLPVDWTQLSFTYTDAGANDPTNPPDWRLSDFNNGIPVTAQSADRANGTGNQGKGKYRIYLVRNGQATYDDHMTIVVNTSQSDVNSAKCAASSAPTLTPTPTNTPTSVLVPTATPPFSQYCTDNLLLNPSFELGTVNWTGITGTGNHNYVIPDGTKYGYHAGSVNSKMYQDVNVVPGGSYSMSFFSASHEPGVQTVAIEYLTAANATVGTPAVHTITVDIDDPSHVFGGPYTLSLGAAPANAAKLRVTVKSMGQTGPRLTPSVLRGLHQ